MDSETNENSTAHGRRAADRYAYTGGGSDGFAVLLKRGGQWFPILDEDGEFINGFETAADAHGFAGRNPLCLTAEQVLVIDLHAAECV